MTTHDYKVKELPVKYLDGNCVLVGECGGLSAVFKVYESSVMFGCSVVETEHGSLYFDSEENVEVLDLP